MSGRGRSAAAAPADHRRPPVLASGGLLVIHSDDQGRTARFDFTTLPGPTPFRQSLARLFAARCAPAGTWRSVKTSKGAWWAIRPFTQFLDAHEDAPQDVGDLTAGFWNAWRLSLAPRAFDYTKHSRVAGLLQQDPRLPHAVREAMAKRFVWSARGERAYRPEEFRAIRSAARRTFRPALQRIRENTRRLEEWRAGAVGHGTPQWLLGEALDVLARTGNVPLKPLKSGGMRAVFRYRAVLGGTGSLHTWRRLYLSRKEAAALGVLIAAEFGFNATTICELAVPTVVPDSGPAAGLIYRLSLEKRRRSGRGRFESRNVADMGADSAGRLLSEALEATAPARTALSPRAEADRLLVWHETTPHDGQNYPGEIRIGPFGFGTDERATKDWGRSVGLPGSPMRRLRKTVNVLYRREPGQNSQDTHDRVYVLPEPQVQEAAIPVIADGAVNAWQSARRTVFQARITQQPDWNHQSATCGCVDYTNSPFGLPGQSCTASFLMCTACPNARVTPAHHARLAHLHQALGSLRGALEPAVWDADWAEAHARLSDLGQRLGDAVWSAALAEVTAADRARIDQLLKGDFDL
ncbi:hypothetical protein [[Kitasatospora] papulosa]|uniref:hypothetical protein n=1 Tax=[Kitasatospora] papulosa TaxID=1464011 RepID=UPI0036A2BBC2